MMAAFMDVAAPLSVLIVSDDYALRTQVRNAVLGPGRYVFDCNMRDARALARTIQLHAVVVIGEGSSQLVATLQEGLLGARVPSRRITVVSSAEDAAFVLLRSFDNPR